MRKLCIALTCLFPSHVSAQEGVGPRVSVQSSALQEVGPWGASALPAGLLPLPSDLWRGADPDTLAVLFTKISPDQRFPSLQSLTRQAIFSGGTAPTSDPDIARTRFEAAALFGPSEAAARLVFGVPRLASSPALASIAIDAGLRVGRTEEACNLIEAVAGPREGTVWLEARAACYALNDEPAAANLSVDLAKARGLTDTWLSRAIAGVAAPLTSPPPFRMDSGRALALSLKAKLKVPLTLTESQDPAAISALVDTADFMASLSPEERLVLARNGAVRGVVSLPSLGSFMPAPDPASVVAPVPAQITQKILSATHLAARALEGRMAIADLKIIMATQPGLMNLTDVPVLTEAALWGGESELASSIAHLSPAAIDPRLALVLALYNPGAVPQAIEQRLAAAGNNPAARRVAVRDAVIAWSAGLPVGRDVSHLVQYGLPSAPAGNAGLRAALDFGASRGSKGEVILLAAFAMQASDPASVDAETLIAAVKALRRVGLPLAARDLARDYLLATFVTFPARVPIRPRSAPTTRAPQPAARRPQAPIAKVSPIAQPAPRPTPRAAQQTQPAVPSARIKPTWGTP